MEQNKYHNNINTVEELAEINKAEIDSPKLYKVVLLNDDYTPMDFVVQILINFFGMAQDSATRVMLDVHYHGRGICGIYTKDIAEAKVSQVIEFSKENQYPLLCQMEQD